MAEVKKDWVQKELQRLAGFDWELHEILERALDALERPLEWERIKNAILANQSADEAFAMIKERASEASTYYDKKDGEWRQNAISEVDDRDPNTKIWVADLINQIPDQTTWAEVLDILSEVRRDREKRARKKKSKSGSGDRNATARRQRRTRYLIEKRDFDYLPRSIKQDMPENIKRLPELKGRFKRLKTMDQLAEFDALIARFPHCAQAIRGLLKGVERHWGLGSNIIRLQPTILVGQPGVGKSKMAREFGKVLNLYTHSASVAGYRDANLFGVSAGWSTAMPSIVTTTVADAKILNPIILLDEIDKAQDTKNGAIHSELLALLEPEEAKRYRERYLATAVDASYVNWIFSANDLSLVPAPLLSRCAVYRIPQPTPDQVPLIIRSMVADYAAENGLRKEFFQLDGGEIEALTSRYRDSGSVRNLGRVVREYLHVKEIGRA